MRPPWFAPKAAKIPFEPASGLQTDPLCGSKIQPSSVLHWLRSKGIGALGMSPQVNAPHLYRRAATAKPDMLIAKNHWR